MFRAGDRWWHRNCLDLDIIIVRVTYNNPSLTRAKVLYWHRDYGTLMNNTAETVTIKKKDFKNWTLVDQG